MNKIRAVVIDDEHFNRGLIRLLITKLNDNYFVAGEAESIEDGFNLIEREKPNVVFLDIKMQDGSGFDLLNLFKKIDFEIVFVTGFDEYTLKAFELNAVDYVLKPIDLDKFRDTLSRVEERVKNNSTDAGTIQRIMQSYDSKSAQLTQIPVNYNDSLVMLEIDSIMYLYVENNCTVFIKAPAEKFISFKPIKDFELIIGNCKNFFHINKSTYVNIDYISRCSKGSDCYITMKDGEVMDFQRHKKEELLQLLNHKKTL